jgi:hypothetical protein
MEANQNVQLSGGCQDRPGANERIYAVGGQTYRYKQYLREVGMRWDPVSQLWRGRLGNGRAWYMRVKLGLEVVPAGGEGVEAPKPALEIAQRSPVSPIRLQKAPAPSHKSDESETSWEAYSALPVKTKREARVHPELNINHRDCYWGCEFCQSCMECISNVDENEVLPHPELDFWDSEEERVKETAVLPFEA